MNKKYNVVMVIMIFFSGQINFAAQSLDVNQYEYIVNAYNSGNLVNIDKVQAINVVQGYKQALEKRRDAIQSSYIPVLLKLIAGGLVSASTIAFGLSLFGAFGSHVILNQSTIGLGYLDFLKYFYGLDKSTIFTGRGKYTEELIKTLPEEQGITVGLGIAAPSLVGGSLVIGAMARYLFNKAASYKNEIVRLEKEIDRDNKIIEVLQEQLAVLLEEAGERWGFNRP